MRTYLLAITLVLGFAAQALAQPIVYIGGRDQNKVSVVDANTNRVIDVFKSPITGSLEGSTVSSDNKYIYYTGDGGIIKIDTSNNQIVAETTLSNNTFAIQVSPDGNTLYTADPATSSVTVLNASDLSVITAIDVDSTPQDITITPDGSKVYTANIGGNSVSVIDTATNTLITSINTGLSGTRRICAHPGGQLVYASNSFSDRVSVVDTNTDTIIDTIIVGNSPNSIVFSPDGEYGYTANGTSEDVTVIRVSDGAVVNTFSAGGMQFPTGIDITPDGQFLYVTNILADSVSVISTASGSLLTVITNKIFDGPIARGRFVVNAPPPTPLAIPTLSEWGLIAMAGVLGIVGLLVVRRRKLAA